MRDNNARIVFASPDPRPGPEYWSEMCKRLGTELMIEGTHPNRIELWSLFHKAVQTAQVFEFGHVPDQRLKETARRAGPLLAAGVMDLPFRSVIYYYSCDVGPDKEPIRMTTLAVSGVIADTGELCYVAVDFFRIPDSKTLNLPSKYAFALCAAGTFVVGKDEEQEAVWRGVLIEGDEQINFNDQLGSLADGVAGLTMILNTKGIAQNTETPSEKLQRKRASNDKPRLPTITHVDTRHYFTAHKNADGGGTHASPVPHLRRGHIRHYRNGTKKRMEPHTVWIKDMVVNCKSMDDIKAMNKRDHYDVGQEA